MNKEADLRAALQCPSNSSSASSLNLAAPGGPSFQGRQSSSIVLMSLLLPCVREVTAQGRQPGLCGFPRCSLGAGLLCLA